MKKRFLSMLALIMALVMVLSACGSKSVAEAPAADAPAADAPAADAPAADAPAADAVEFVVAVSTDVKTFDLMNTSAGADNQVMYHVFEQLTMLDYASKLNPQLATSWECNDDYTEWSLKLKEGVKFHDGSDFNADDAVASLTRYARMGRRAATFEGAKFEKVDDYNIKITLPAGNPLLMETLGTEGMGGIIMIPAEVCGEEYDAAFGLEQAIGTGPYKMVSYEPDTQVVLEKFADYIPDSGENNGFGGEKIANFDTLIWKIVPDAAQRLNGLLAGEYQYAAELNVSAYNTLEATEGVEINTIPGSWIPWTVFNSQNSVFSDLRLRQAFILALDMEECMLAATAGNDALYELDHSLFFKNQLWYSDVGSEWYNQNNDEKAKELMAEAGYNGEELVWVVTQDYQWMYDVAVVVQQQAQEVGFNIRLDVYDWTTCVSYLQNGQKEKEFDLWTTGFSYPDVVDPTAIDSLFTVDTVWPYESEEMDAIVKSGHSADQAARVAAYNNLVEQWYKDMYGVIYGKMSSIGGYASNVELCQQYTNLRFFNCSYK